jgi:hypothetical protein
MVFDHIPDPTGAQRRGHLHVVCPFCSAAVSSSSPCTHVLLGFEGTTPFGAAAPRYRELLQMLFDQAIAFEDDQESIENAAESLFGMIMNSADMRQEGDGIKAVFIRDPSRAGSLIEQQLPFEP